MTSPAFLYLSLDTHSISGAFPAATAAEAVILAGFGITSRFVHADQGEPTRRERGYATMQLAGPDLFGFPRRAERAPYSERSRNDNRNHRHRQNRWRRRPASG
jgi:hypothetical protein